MFAMKTFAGRFGTKWLTERIMAIGDILRRTLGDLPSPLYVVHVHC